MILIISNKWDVSVDFIVKELKQQNEKFIRLNTEIFPQPDCSINLPDFSFILSNGLTITDLTNNLKSVLFRRPGKPFEQYEKKHKKLPPELIHSREQWHTFIEGIWCLDNVLWINNPNANDIMENKILQLRKAVNNGFKIPKTCITSDKNKAKHFLKKCGGEIVAKSLYSPLIEYPEKDYFIFTTVINNFKDVPKLEIEIAPLIFQELIKDKVDYRVTVIGNKIFPVRIEGMNNETVPIDWRTKKNGLQFIPCKLPYNISEKCKEYVNNNNLVFGAIDLVENNNNFYFLEINPNGEWGWLQKCTELPIAESIVEYLVKGMT